METYVKYVKMLWKIPKYLIFIIKHAFLWVRCNMKQGLSNNFTCLNGKTAIITGGNSGIGYTTALLLASRGCRVIIACRRNATKEREDLIKETNNPNISVKHLDLSRFESVRQFAENIKKEEKKIDILINNAGIGYSQMTLTDDGLDIVMQTNYLGHFLLTHLLIDLLKEADDARIIFLTSCSAYFRNLSVDRLYPARTVNLDSRFKSYSNSKAYGIVAAQEMDKKVAKFGIRVFSADPGIVRTHIFDSLEGPEQEKTIFRNTMKCTTFLLNTESRRASETILHLATSKDVKGGLNYFRCEPFPKPMGLDNASLCQDIWKESEKIVKLRPEEILE